MDDSQLSIKRERYDSPPLLERQSIERPLKKARKDREFSKVLPPPPPPAVEFSIPKQEEDDSASSDIKEECDEREKLRLEPQIISQSSLGFDKNNGIFTAFVKPLGPPPSTGKRGLYTTAGGD